MSIFLQKYGKKFNNIQIYILCKEIQLKVKIYIKYELKEQNNIIKTNNRCLSIWYVDADTILIYKTIKNETKNSLIIVELLSVKAISFINWINDDSNVRKQGYWLSEPFTLGEIYIS